MSEEKQLDFMRSIYGKATTK
jgi:hypothetical protein